MSSDGPISDFELRALRLLRQRAMSADELGQVLWPKRRIDGVHMTKQGARRAASNTLARLLERGLVVRFIRWGRPIYGATDNGKRAVDQRTLT